MEYSVDKLADLIEAFECTFRARVNRLSACHQVGVTPFQAKVLMLVERNVGCSQKEIADLLLRDKAQVGRTVKELEELNFITRKPLKAGGRVLSLSLTTEGELICNRLNGFRRIIVEEMFCCMSLDYQDKLVSILSSVFKDFSEHSSQNDRSYFDRYELEVL